ncbi:hypothetical protein NO559_07845 [Dasania sp. GY-MA-18]|uniref:Uncharacterized protein n=1 Tax=Dasania phycosphaerae TaxID=2950436 RepID=A0A9J6RL07_9GAMM|nr:MULTISPECIES: hypothetical protein [Dasania]MCR8922678.1 hypothetical protein [Dasania sp. GY-MA-18]MCZ0865108.1 hypothetical protein [Dasania phycosphaerae]MCZ0868834.1 hypothetical protein [Dasania phycosphaerae]
MKNETKQQPNVVSFRPASAELNQRLARIATRERRKPSQMARVLVEDGLARKEKELGLPPIGDELQVAAR